MVGKKHGCLSHQLNLFCFDFFKICFFKNWANLIKVIIYIYILYVPDDFVFFFSTSVSLGLGVWGGLGLPMPTAG